MMGSGKSTVGKLLADTVQCPFKDCDEILSRRAHRSIAELFRMDGEATFRKHEHELLKELLLDSNLAIIATGGGVPLDKRNRDLLKERAYCVFLKAPANMLAQRIKAQSVSDARPLLEATNADIQSRIAELMQAREPLYTALADFEISTEVQTLPKIVSALQDWYKTHSGGKI